MPPADSAHPSPAAIEEPQRLRIRILGAVQGVGFRPFVYRLARELGLRGWVRNSPSGVSVEAEGPRPRLDELLLRIEREKPPRASILSLEASFLDPAEHGPFEILGSAEEGARTAFVLPDIATCADCLAEVFDHANRRHLYPFTNCTNCGPRYSIIEGLPYDRLRTTMRRFPMCDACRREYEDPADRRFHAQPNACPACGPHLELWGPGGETLASRHEALLSAAARIRRGGIVAVKGLGGFHILCDARLDAAVLELRRRKRREEKPLAVMFPSLAELRASLEVSPLEERLLGSAEAPIVLVRARRTRGGSCGGPGDGIAPSVAPGNPYLGALLPYTPLHHILTRELGFPVVATSGNLSDEPIATDEREALGRLEGIADAFLVHDRPIARHVDDSVARVMAGRELVLRRARGYAPLPVPIGGPEGTILGVGAHLKNTVALSTAGQVFVGQHVGDLETIEANAAFRAVVESLQALHESRPERVACDLHPDYFSTAHARSLGLPVDAIQHHHAHVVSCMAESELEGRVLGVSWDGTGYGTDGTVWGGEFLLASRDSFERVAHLRTFRLPGGDRAIKEPRRSALGVLHEIFAVGGSGLETVSGLEDLPTLCSFSPEERGVLEKMLSSGINAPFTSSAGRLFDAVASILGIRQRVRFEGQAAMELEFAADGADEVRPSRRYHMPVAEGAGTPAILDWGPAIVEILEDLRRGVPRSEIAAGFHEALLGCIVEIATRVGESRVVLTGGCFQNRYLMEGAVRRLSAAGFRPYWHQRIPPNDGGISLGQVAAAAARHSQSRQGAKG